jgi:DNA polymerase I-like protein with 3'-5' exonuclease and polymerase domains
MGLPVSGFAGRMLRPMVRKHWQGPVAYDLAIRCTHGREEVKPKHIDACNAYLAGTLREVKPTRIVALGPQAAYALLGRSVQPMMTRRAQGWLSGVNCDGKPIPVFVVLSPVGCRQNRFLRAMLEEDMEWALTATPQEAPWSADVRVVETEEDALEAERELSDSAWIAFDVETVGTMWKPDFRIICTAVCADGTDAPWVWPTDAMDNPKLREPLRRLLTGREIAKAGQNVKYDQLAFRAAYGWQVRPIVLDTRLQRKLQEPEGDGSLAAMSELVGMGGLKEEAEDSMTKNAAKVRRALAKAHPDDDGPLVKDLPLSPKLERLLRSGAEQDTHRYWMMPEDTLIRYNARDAVATARLGVFQAESIQKEPDILRTWKTIVRPASVALERIEAWGVPASKDAIVAFDQYLGVKEAEAKAVLDQYGSEMNWNSTPQIGALLYGTLGLKPPRMTDAGKPSTDADALEELSKHHPLPKALLDYRKVVKLRGTYASGMLEHVRPDGRIHPNIKLDGARSGRTSCIAGWCLVRTRRGDVPMRDVRVGDEVWTHRGRWRRVLAAWSNGLRPVVSATLSSGDVLTCTSDHRFLSSSGRWHALEDIYEHQQAMGGGQEESGRGCRSLQGQAMPDLREDCLGVEHTPRECTAHCCVLHPARRKEGACILSVLSEQAGRQEPNVRQERAGAPQLDWGVRGRSRLPDVHVEWAAGVRASCGDDAGARCATTTEWDGSSSHRQRPEEQLAGQPRSGNGQWSQADSLLAGEGQSRHFFTQVQVSGCVEVHDLSVEDDESFLVCGVFAHNCTQPNLQNIPRAQSVEGKMARDCFAARPGFTILECDYSQLELRIAAALSGDPEMRGIFEAGVDYHLRTAQLVSQTAWGIPPEQVEDKHRSQAKGFNFGLLYGQGDSALAQNIGCTVQQAGRIREAILGKFSVLARWIQEMLQYATKNGHAWTWWDGHRARRRPLWRIADDNDAGASVARNSAHNTPIQGTASDFCIASLIECVRWIEGDNLENDVKLCLPVHDALLFEVRADMLPEVHANVMRIMQSWNSNGVPLIADAKAGPSWGSLEKYPPKEKK